MLYWSAATLLLLLGLLQILCYGPVLKRLLRRAFGKYVSIGFRGRGLLLPLLYFEARAFKILAPGGPHHDRNYFEARKIRFRIDPFFLLIGRLRMVRLVMEEPYLEYINRMESHKKNRYLPPRHRVEWKGASIRNGHVFVKDETMTPVYQIELTEIEVDNMDMDVGTSIDFLFRTERGEAKMASGSIELTGQPSRGTITLRNIYWKEIANLESIPFPSGRLQLNAYHTGGSSGRRVQGALGQHNADGTEDAVNFAFDIDWNDYRLTLDLGLQKLIDEILRNAEASWIGSGIVLGGRGVFEILKKPQGDTPEQ